MVIVFCFKKTSRVAVYVILKMKKILIMMQHFKVWSVQFIYFPFVNKVCEGRNICMKGRPQEFATIYISGVSFKFPPRLIDCPPSEKRFSQPGKILEKYAVDCRNYPTFIYHCRLLKRILGVFSFPPIEKGIFFSLRPTILPKYIRTVLDANNNSKSLSQKKH